MSDKIQFVPFCTTVSPGFWYQLANKKLNHFKLDDSAQPVIGHYTNTDTSGLPCRHSIEYSSFEIENPPPPLCHTSRGNLFNRNTVEEFKVINKKELLQGQAGILWKDIVSGKAIQEPSLLSRFCILSFADLKKYCFYYWFGYPTFLHSTDSFSVVRSCPIADKESDSFITRLETEWGNFNSIDRNGVNNGFFLISIQRTSDGTLPILHHLNCFSELLDKKVEFWFGFADPSTLPMHPGWPLRNFLLLIYLHWGRLLNNGVNILCLRDRTMHGTRTMRHSLWMQLKIEFDDALSLASECLGATGWERNKNNKLGPRFVDMRETMDPVKLAETAVDLNLKLMRWRLIPSLDLEKISTSKCLLLGAGTLGCNVARALLGWGVKKITLLDNGKVSFSNPVRQTLYEFTDCSAGGGRPKALAAAERLLKIFPGIDATGVELSIPMPGHPVNTNEKTYKNAEKDIVELTELIENHDVVFLLMDSRESRWLPTVIAAERKKLVINAALGFDSYLVMRHGVAGDNEPGSSTLQPKLGCYFCNDVVAPGNSIRDRTLDQQCTVSRPGVSMIASALAVELFASVVQTPEEGKHIPSDSIDGADQVEFPLGRSPHQIRGFLSSHQMLLPSTLSFTKCTACSEEVLNQYRTLGLEFLMNVFNSPPQFLEDVTGLTQLHQETALAEDEILEFSDSESI